MRRTLAAVAAAGTVLILASCNLPSTAPAAPDLPSDPPVSTPAPSDGPATSLPTPAVTPAAATPSSTPTQAVGEEPVATRAGSIDKVRVTAQVFPVRRSGGTATVDLYIASRDPEETFMVSDNLGDGNTETASKSERSVDGIRLLDTTAKRAYLPAVTADGACVCSPDDDNTLTFNSSVWVTVTFAAPPASVTTMSVSVPSFGTFTDVPVI
jgi:hypothetical protein